MLSFLDDPSQNSNLANESVGKEELKEDTDRWGVGGGGGVGGRLWATCESGSLVPYHT